MDGESKRASRGLATFGTFWRCSHVRPVLLPNVLPGVYRRSKNRWPPGGLPWSWKTSRLIGDSEAPGQISLGDLLEKHPLPPTCHWGAVGRVGRVSRDATLSNASPFSSLGASNSRTCVTCVFGLKYVRQLHFYRDHVYVIFYCPSASLFGRCGSCRALVLVEL